MSFLEVDGKGRGGRTENFGHGRDLQTATDDDEQAEQSGRGQKVDAD